MLFNIFSIQFAINRNSVYRYRPFIYDQRDENKKRTFISKLIGDSDEPIFSRLFLKKSECNRASAHLVNAMGISASIAFDL